MEISLRDLDGREVLLKENVISSSKVNQPILCYGRLMEHGRGISSREQMLENGELKVPLNLQNRSLTVQGRIRVIRDEDENCLEVQVPVWRKNQVGDDCEPIDFQFVDPPVIPLQKNHPS